MKCRNMRRVAAIEPEMSHSTTSGGGRRRALAAAEFDQALRPQARRQGRAHVGRGPARRRAVAARRRSGTGRRSCAIARRGRVDLGLRHLLEVHCPAAPRGPRRSRSRRSRLRAARSSSLRRLALPGCSASCRRRLSSLRSSGSARHVDLRQQHLHHLLEQTRIAPKDVEGLVENLAAGRAGSRRPECSVQ